MRHRFLGLVGALALVALAASPATAGYPLVGTLAKEENIVLVCTVSDALTATECKPPPWPPVQSVAASKRAQAFIQEEAINPDYLAGATPGARVLVMIRRSTAAVLDGANPGRALAPPSPALAAVTAPDWRVMPSAGKMAGYYPDREHRNGLSGNAAAQCTVGAGGDLLGCWILAGDHPDFGFGWVTLQLSTNVQMNPATKDGLPTVGRPYVLQAAFKAQSMKVTLSNGK
jgi:hypothetical protein